MTRSEKIPMLESNPWVCHSRGRRLNHQANETFFFGRGGGGGSEPGGGGEGKDWACFAQVSHRERCSRKRLHFVALLGLMKHTSALILSEPAPA